MDFDKSTSPREAPTCAAVSTKTASQRGAYDVFSWTRAGMLDPTRGRRAAGRGRRAATDDCCVHAMDAAKIEIDAAPFSSLSVGPIPSSK